MTIRFTALILVAAVVGCASRSDCVPSSLNVAKLTDLGAEPDAHAPVSKGLTREVEAEFLRRTAAHHPPGARPYHFLALSGGGQYGAFGVGVLTGWTETNTRPEFDVVAGISTGALMATFAFLGPAFDRVMEDEGVAVEQKDLLRRRSVLTIPFTAALFDSSPLARRLERAITTDVLRQVAATHAAGRRLYVGTTNIDTKRLIIWDMGAIAARGTAESAKLYRDVILASCSIPGGFSPVRIPVEIDGKTYTEMHVDGGVSDEVIFRAFMVGDLNRMAGVPGAIAPPGSTLTIISNGKLYAEPDCVRPRLLGIIPASFRSIIYGKTRDEMFRIYLNCLECGVAFRLAAVPEDTKLGTPGSLNISVADQRKMFEIGKTIGRVAQNSPQWRDVPAGTDPTEQALPRTGTRFASLVRLATHTP
jgi:hypothetical protein